MNKRLHIKINDKECVITILSKETNSQLASLQLEDAGPRGFRSMDFNQQGDKLNASDHN
jgi:hypothetical protein